MDEVSTRDKSLVYHQKILGLFIKRDPANWRCKHTGSYFEFGDAILKAISSQCKIRTKQKRLEWIKLSDEIGDIKKVPPLQKFDEYHLSGFFF